MGAPLPPIDIVDVGGGTEHSIDIDVLFFFGPTLCLCFVCFGMCCHYCCEQFIISFQSLSNTLQTQTQKGHHVSRFVKDELSPELLKCYNKLPSQPDIDSGVATASTTEAIVQNAFDTVTTRLQRAAINAQASGSTTVACARKGDTLLVANVGDSRAVLGRRDADFGNQIRAVPLTVDHNLDTNKHEVARVRQIGGEVEPIYIPGAGFRGPARLWSKRQQAGGLAVSRSFGDIHLRAAGVSSVPEVRMQKIQQEDKFVILASDGVWDFMTNQEACDIVGKKKDPREASKALVAVARERWQRQGGNNYVDDVTALVANLNPFNRG